ncbi:hypothetical protein BT96DRAFT_1019592 [Gymnopus androsaceus JB14]|uniref:Ion transport domain-containing protein n=1 Tax=Gymnopus androsaceus JB14 TaxID=1447944 RepID=A0A6A4HQG4_9AGAR|nr:hypothetical protein BT96DRAFT_1019592 [Gymnopus androsaceus JB14]
MLIKLIPAIKKEVIRTIDSPLNWDQLTASDISFSIVRPIVFKFARLKNLAVVYACLRRAIMIWLMPESNLTRANLCELLAMKLLSYFASDHMNLVAALTTSWNPLTGATSSFVDEVQQVLRCDDEDLNYPQSALEMAVSTKSTKFLSSPVAQKVVNDIYSGRVIFSTAATRSVLADNYKPRSIQFYDWREAPFLDHYRLRVPKYGAILEFLNFAVLLLTFILCLANRNLGQTNFWEWVFILFAGAFAFEEYTASTEHGWKIYIANMWNVFDTTFVIIFFHVSDFAHTRTFWIGSLAFFAVSNTVVVLALRAMIAEFVFFIGIAAICFSGLLFTLWTLVLISILSNTVARIDANITQEYLFQFTISTIEGVNADALFSYQPPFNILAFLILKPASWIISPRALHSLNVFLIKLTSFPILIAIGVYERYLAHGQSLRESGKGAAQSLFNSLPRQIKNIPIVEALVGSTSANIYDAIFDVEAEHDAELFGDSDEDEAPALRSLNVVSPPASPTSVRRVRKTSSLAPSTSGVRRDPSPSSGLRPISTNLEPSASAEVPTVRTKSPLTRLFVRTPSTENPVSAAATSVEASVRRVETLVDEMKGIPLQKIREEMKELQDRQARIENLLLALTRGMRQSDLDRSH